MLFKFWARSDKYIYIVFAKTLWASKTTEYSLFDIWTNHMRMMHSIIPLYSLNKEQKDKYKEANRTRIPLRLDRTYVIW